MINLINQSRMHMSYIDKHSHIVDLVYFDGALLSLFRDQKSNWLYLWCDSKESKERWLIFPVSRDSLVKYLKSEYSLLSIIQENTFHLILDSTEKINPSKDNPEIKVHSIHRSLKRLDNLRLIQEYLPSADSLFDPNLAPDIAANREFNPTSFDVPIAGQWFVNDLEKFNRLYAQLYGFFYCSQPQFIADLGKKVASNLSAPWLGGFSRVHLFDALKKMVPSIHDLEIKQMRYNSPGEIRIEALASVGNSVLNAILKYIENEILIVASLKAITTLLSSSNLNKTDLSLKRDDQLPLNETQKLFLREKQKIIADSLNIEAELLFPFHIGFFEKNHVGLKRNVLPIYLNH